MVTRGLGRQLGIMLKRPALFLLPLPLALAPPRAPALASARAHAGFNQRTSAHTRSNMFQPHRAPLITAQVDTDTPSGGHGLRDAAPCIFRAARLRDGLNSLRGDPLSPPPQPAYDRAWAGGWAARGPRGTSRTGNDAADRGRDRRRRRRSSSSSSSCGAGRSSPSPSPSPSSQRCCRRPTLRGPRAAE